jgi:O-antigen/teichoic acid export membrane protein
MTISTVKKNVAANFISNGWSALIGVLLVPLYIKFLGVEDWGVVGIYISLQAVCVLLDLGLTATLNRELARLSVRQDTAQEMRNLVRTLELIYWAVAILIGVSIFLAAPLIANYWLKADQLPAQTLQDAIRLIAVAITLQWPFGLYSAGLSGLQRQVVLSTINVSIATLRGLGALIILWKISPTLQALFSWLVVMSMSQTSLVGLVLWRSLPRTETTSTFQSTILRNTWRFSAGMGGITILGVIITQMDKAILSRLLDLKTFGYYVLAGTVGTGLYLIFAPIFSALQPRFTQLVTVGDERGLKRLYHDSCQLMSVLIIPITALIALFSREILFLWTGNATTAENAHLILRILIVGTGLNGLVHLPYALQVAYGWTKLAFYFNLVAVIVMIPLIIVLTTLYGAIGAASVWLAFSCGYVLIGIQLMHRRILRGQQWKWYFEDVGLPMAVSFGTALLCLAIVPIHGPRYQLLIVLAGIYLFVMASTSLATPVTRAAMVVFLRSGKARVLDYHNGIPERLEK